MSFRHFPSPFARKLSQLSNDRSFKKRKREDSDDNSVIDDGSGTEIENSSPSDPQYPALAALPANIALQYEKAGQPFDEHPPSGRFPHCGIEISSISGGTLSQSRLHDELAVLNPPLSNTDYRLTQFPVFSLKQSHLATLTMLMHRCLLRGDYTRAGRAFGLLLRTEIEGQQVDIRSQNLWGIGVEVLCRRRGQSPTNTESHTGGN